MTPGANDKSVHSSLMVSRLRSGYFLATCATLASAALFVGLGNAILPFFLGEVQLGYYEQGLAVVFLLNIALILFGWRRSKDLREALDAHAMAELRAHENAFSDHVTGLSNRRELVRVIDQLTEIPAAKASLLMLDLDNFKKVNDVYGHAAGDRLLKSVGELLQACGATDICCARLGGDEFAVLFPGSYSSDDVQAFAQTILTTLAEPITLDETNAYVTASIGIAQLGGDCRTTGALLRRADIAMYEAKRHGRNCYIWFDQEMELQLHRRNQLEAEMRLGITRGEFVPFYQPLINLETGELKGFEVLARWNHPEQGLLEPIAFIDIAEASSLISLLSMNVMRQALEEAKHWPSDIGIAVNVSPVQFKDPLLAQRVLQLLTETGFPPKRLEIELTESALMDDQAMALATVESLKNSGIQISLDDFGTGYASLAQLKSLPFDRIKIDRSFVSALLDDEQSNAIVHTIANLGEALRLPITAEGVESAAVRDQLQTIGCSDAQGWLFGEAVPAELVRALLDKHSAGLAATGTAAAGLEEALAAAAAKRKRGGTAA